MGGRSLAPTPIRTRHLSDEESTSDAIEQKKAHRNWLDSHVNFPRCQNQLSGPTIFKIGALYSCRGNARHYRNLGN